MHHPDIHDILLLIKDYSMLSNREPKFKIEPTIYTKPLHFSNPEEDIRERKGLKIIHQLNQGRLEVNIFGSYEDYDCMDAQYFGDEDPVQSLEVTSTFGYNNQSTRDAIRKIMILDRDRNNKANLQ